MCRMVSRMRITLAGTRRIARLGVLAALAAAPGSLMAQTNPPEATLPVKCGYSAATCFSDFNTQFDPTTGINLDAPVVAIVDNRIPGALVPDPGPGLNNWTAAMFHNDFGPPQHRWHARNLGQVFGVTFDNASPPNIYVTATTTYGSDNLAYDNANTTPFATSPFPAGATGGEIYKLDGTNANISLFATLPNIGAAGGTGPGLGNICFDDTTNRFYVSNFYDGRIYSLDLAGNCKGTFDFCSGTITTNTTGACPGESPVPTPGFTPLGCRPWGVKTHEGRLYFSIWTEDRGRPSATASNSIHSISLTAAGDFTGSSQTEIAALPPFVGGVFSIPPTSNWSNPVSDIAFSIAGRMMLAERVRRNDVGSGGQFAAGDDGHTARNLEYELVAGFWTTTAPARQFLIGVDAAYHGVNSSGGIDFDCDDNLWSTGDYVLPSPLVYGLQRTPAAGNTLFTVGLTGFFIDLDGQSGAGQSKNRIGDVVVYRCCCMNVVTETLACVPDGSGNRHTWSFCITNKSGQTARSLLIGAPSGVSINQSSFALVPPLLDGQTRCFTVTLTGAPQWQESCFTFILLNEHGTQCCNIEVCITPPVCCVEAVEGAVTLEPGGDVGTYQYCFKVRNISGFTAFQAFVTAPPGITITPTHFPLVPPVPPGGTSPNTYCITIFGAQPGTRLCFDLSIHDGDFDPCCASIICIDIPPVMAECPCPDPCPGGVESENEPCGTDTNGGCNSTPPVFTSIGVGATYCGDTWAENGFRDTDWYVFNATAATSYTISCTAQFPFELSVLDLPCPTGPRLAIAGADPCVTATLTFTAPATGPYAIVIVDHDFMDTPCGVCNRYVLSIASPQQCTSDEDGDGRIGLGDIAVIIMHFAESGPVGDCNGDGVVGIADVALVILEWGTVCR